VRDLVERESECCSFFTFATRGQDLLRLDVSVNHVHEAVLDAPAARPAAAAEQR
jgi:hypothetical protein